MSLREYLDLTDADFRELFRNSPIKRIKRRGFLRNVCVALGNVGEQSDVPALERAAADPEPLIAEHAAWAIQHIRDRQKQLRSRLFESKPAAHCIQRGEGDERAPLAKV
jgi:epoxyqueuosine reductase